MNEIEIKDDDPRIQVVKELTTKELATLFIDICRANPTGDQDWKYIIREELKTRKDICGQDQDVREQRERRAHSRLD